MGKTWGGGCYALIIRVTIGTGLILVPLSLFQPMLNEFIFRFIYILKCHKGQD